MKHPIYKDRGRNGVREHIVKRMKTLGLEAVKDDIVARFNPAERGGMDDDTLRKSLDADLLAYLVESEVAKKGHILINTSEDRWSSTSSIRTINSLTLDGFKFPFEAATVMMDDDEITFSRRDNRLTVVRYESTGIYLVTIAEGLTIGEVFEEMDASDETRRMVYSLLSLLLYISAFNTNRYIDSQIKPRCSGSNKKKIPKHNVKIITLKPDIRLSNSGSDTTKRESSTKAWVVRGHWRNQYYAKTDDHKPKWMSPYWKGEGKEELGRVYKI